MKPELLVISRLPLLLQNTQTTGSSNHKREAGIMLLHSFTRSKALSFRGNADSSPIILGMVGPYTHSTLSLSLTHSHTRTPHQLTFPSSRAFLATLMVSGTFAAMHRYLKNRCHRKASVSTNSSTHNWKPHRLVYRLALCTTVSQVPGNVAQCSGNLVALPANKYSALHVLVATLCYLHNVWYGYRTW